MLTLCALAGLSAVFLFIPIPWDKVGAWGYLGVAVVVFVATASFILPIPYLLIVWRAHVDGGLDPWLLAGTSGVAAALGELTGYLVGVSGRDLIARGKWFDKAEYWMRTYGFWCVAFFAFIPNPLFDAIGFAAGVMRYSAFRFALACFLGKALKFYVAATFTDLVEIGCHVYEPACGAVKWVLGAIVPSGE
ncbi:MAG: VTT domain-containing protein [Chloroflexota bacterium]